MFAFMSAVETAVENCLFLQEIWA